MRKAQAYYDLVNALLLFEHNVDIKRLLANYLTTMWDKGVSPQDAANALRTALNLEKED